MNVYATPSPSRRLGDAFADAVPDALAALACGIAWQRPDALGFDLLGVAGLLYFIELPLAVLVGFAGIRRVRDGVLSRGAKLWFVLLPMLVLCATSTALLGETGLFAVAWLGAWSIVRLWSDAPERSADVRGLWLVFGKRGAAISFEMTPQRPAPAAGVVVVPAGHEQLMAGATLGTWFALPFALAVLPEFGVGGATAAYAASVGWGDTVIGAAVPAHLALAAGVILFTVRTLGHFEGLGEPPPASVEDDEVLRAVIEKVEGRKPRRTPKSRR